MMVMKHSGPRKDITGRDCPDGGPLLRHGKEPRGERERGEKKKKKEEKGRAWAQERAVATMMGT